MTDPLVKLALQRLEECLAAEIEEFLKILLETMKAVLLFDADYRKNITGFSGRYLFRSVDHSIKVAATFAGGEMRVTEQEIANPHVNIIFKDGRAIMNFLLAAHPDILGSMLRQEVTPEGNLNYLYKFAYMARRLQLMATGQA